MNEKRITELLNQAFSDGHGLFKFAELIVKECVTKISNERKHFNPTEWDQGADWGHKNSIDVLKKHFGV